MVRSDSGAERTFAVSNQSNLPSGLAAGSRVTVKYQTLSDGRYQAQSVAMASGGGSSMSGTSGTTGSDTTGSTGTYGTGSSTTPSSSTGTGSSSTGTGSTSGAYGTTGYGQQQHGHGFQQHDRRDCGQHLWDGQRRWLRPGLHRLDHRLQQHVRHEHDSTSGTTGTTGSTGSYGTTGSTSARDRTGTTSSLDRDHDRTAGSDANLPATAGETPALALAGFVSVVLGLTLLALSRRREV